jgi:hypothetical protein
MNGKCRQGKSSNLAGIFFFNPGGPQDNRFQLSLDQ